MLPRRPPKRLFKNKDVIHAYHNDRSPKSRIKVMLRDHADVLHDIELALVSEAHDGSGIDDCMIDQALRSCIKGTELPDDADTRVVRLRARLERTREFRDDVSDDIWNVGLRTVDESVRRHSSLSPGEVTYLAFVQDYVR